MYTAERWCSSTVVRVYGSVGFGDGRIDVSRANRMRPDAWKPTTSTTLHARTDVLVGLGLTEVVGEGLEAVHVEHALAPVPVGMKALEM